MFLRQLMKLPLDVERTYGFPIFQLDNPFAGRIPGDVARALDGVVQDEIPWQAAVFKKRKNTGGRAHLQCRRERTHVRIANEKMESSIFSVVSERFISRIDDGAVELHPLVNVV